jgi:hypothetical protein
VALGSVVHRQPGKREYDVSARCTQPQEARKSAPGFLDISATTCVGGGTGTPIDVQGRVGPPPPLSPIDGGTAVNPNWNTS